MTMHQKNLNIAIVGAGIAGLASAIALLKNGYNVSVFEKKAELGELGAGLQLSPNATHVLNEWGLLSNIEKVAFKPDGIRFSHWESGNIIANFPLNHQAESNPYLHIHRADLHECLVEAVLALSPNCINRDAEVVKIANTPSNCEFTCQNTEGKQTNYLVDWLIGADGIHSLCKSEIIEQENHSLFTGNIAWRGVIPIEKLKNRPEPKAHLVMGPKSHLVFYYIKGGKYLNFVAIKEGSQFQIESWTEKGELKKLLNDFKGWHTSYLDILSKTDESDCFRWALHDRDALTIWHKNRCIILGDAAHPVLPFLAQGAALAIEDAQALSLSFEKYFQDTSLNIGDDFFKNRINRCTQVLESSRNNMTIYHETNFIKQKIRDLGVHIFSKLNPEFLNKKLDWLYDYKL